jgi:hypothetical protein
VRNERDVDSLPNQYRPVRNCRGRRARLEDMHEWSSSNPFDCRNDEACIGRIFMVHLGLDADPASGRFCGRVQHVRSEDATHFASLDELKRFVFEHIEIQAGRTGAVGNDDNA